MPRKNNVKCDLCFDSELKVCILLHYAPNNSFFCCFLVFTVSIEMPDYRVPEPDEMVEVCLVSNVPASEEVIVMGIGRNSDPADATGKKESMT